MKLIIDIPDQEYNDCKNRFNMIYQEGYLNYNLNTALIMYIANGTIIPKGHGRLLDEDKLLSMLVFGKHIDDCKCVEIAEVCNKAVVIEADKEKKECEYYDSEAETCRRSETEFDELNNLYYGMTDSMQKAVKDIMLVANGKDIEE